MTTEFLLESDILESTIMKADKSFRMPEDLLNEFIEDTNQWYEEEALELLVPIEDIMVYDISVDLKDLRDKKMVKLATYNCLMDICFSLAKGDRNKTEDVYWMKYNKLETKFNNLLSAMSYYRIIGEKPAVIKTSGGCSSVETSRG